MLKLNAYNAINLPKLLFPGTDFNTALGRFYDAQNEIAIAVSEYRFKHKLTQAALAAKLGITQAMVSKYESGSYNISLKAAFELFDQLGMRFNCKIEDEPSQQTIAFDTDEHFSRIGTGKDDAFPIQAADDLLIA